MGNIIKYAFPIEWKKFVLSQYCHVIDTVRTFLSVGYICLCIYEKFEKGTEEHEAHN